MKLTRPIIWTGLALGVAALLFLTSPNGEGDKSKPGNLQAYATASLAKLQIFDDPQALPAFTFKAEDGAVQSLDAYKGKVVLLNLWATWCAPCVAEMPSLDRLQDAYGGQGFTVIALSLDRQGLEKVAPFYRRLGIANLDIFLDENSRSMRALEAGTLPISLLIGRDGKALARLDGPAEWDSAEAMALVENVIGR